MSVSEIRGPAYRHSASKTRVNALMAHAGYQLAVVPAKAGTHIPEAVVMGPRFRGDDSI
jgi:hypothetical protein